MAVCNTGRDDDIKKTGNDFIVLYEPVRASTYMYTNYVTVGDMKYRNE